MPRYLLKRFSQAVLVLFAVSILSFVLIYLSGDPVRAIAPLDALPEDVQNLKVQFGLDQPIYIQYLKFVRQAFKGDLGESFRYRQESLKLVLQRLPVTFLLVSAAVIIAICVAIPLGIFTATRKNTFFDYGGTVVSLVGLSVPTFWIGIMLILIFADYLRILPPSGKGGLSHLILPAVTNSFNLIGLLTRLTRTTMVEETGEELYRGPQGQRAP